MKHCTFEVDQRGVARLTFNRPQVRNAFDAILMTETAEVLSSLEPGVRVLVIAGEGKVFSAGADLGWMKGAGAAQGVSDSKMLQDMFVALDRCSVPVVARVHGAAIAGAAGLVAACDIAIAARSAVFAFTEVRLGLVPAVISPYVVRKVGHSFARAAFMTAERFDAERALQVGLVHRVVDDDALDAAVDEVVDQLLQAGPGSLIESRRVVQEVSGMTPDEVAEMTLQTITKLRGSEEGQEGVTAFLEKRPPRWST